MEQFTKLAQAQLIGYSLAKDGLSIVDIVRGMALQEHEWEEIKQNTSDLSEKEINQINKYFEDYG